MFFFLQATVTREPTDIKIVFPEPHQSEEQTSTYSRHADKPQYAPAPNRQASVVTYPQPAPVPVSPPRYAAPASPPRYAAQDDAPRRQQYYAPPPPPQQSYEQPRKQQSRKYSGEQERPSGEQVGVYRVRTPTYEQYVNFGGNARRQSQDED